MIFEAFASLPLPIQTGHRLAFAGRLFDGEIRQLRLAAARHGIPSTALRFCQYVTDDDLVGLYQASAAFVFPSLHEGFGLPALEAMACGAAVLASNATSLPEVVGNDAFMFDPRDASDLAAKLQRLLVDADARHAARTWGTQRAAAFTWENSARRTLSAFEEVYAARRASSALRRREPALITAKPRMAFVSPLPPEQSGIANYSAELLRELGRFYQIDCIVTGTGYDDPWVDANFVIRDVAFFERNASTYHRIVYSFGNSHFHAHMLGLVERFAGVVILHDFYLSDLIEWMSHAGHLPVGGFARELYRSHGLSALVADKQLGRLHAIDTYPCNGVVFRAASKVIVHSHYAVDQTRRFFGSETAGRLTVIPHLRALPIAADRTRARQRLGLANDALLVCSFGILTRRKCSRDLFDAWLASRAGGRADARLVFVGANQAGPYGDDLEAAIESARGTRTAVITGYADEDVYRDYLAAADIAVQLRTTSRGETSGTILDCLAQGVPLIINGHGTGRRVSGRCGHQAGGCLRTRCLEQGHRRALRRPADARDPR